MQLKNNMKDLILYVIVGGLATVAEWVVFYLLNGVLSMGYMIATVLAYILSTFANWAFGRLIMFRGDGNLLAELCKIYLASLVGLGLNLLIMWILVDKLCVAEMVSKMAATALVFLWNYLIRRLVIYKSENNGR